ncbi:MAG: cadherin-like beta sandwich domain-containing protein [Nitrospira sp.]|nr:cadherin-like beta sandwich domain-containing protein [Nitrospira sp.]
MSIMRRFVAIPARYLIITLLIGTTGLSLYGCADTGSIDPGPQLAGLSVSGASLQPPFTSETTGYHVDLPSNSPDVTVSATKSDPNDVLSGAVTAPAGQDTGQSTISPPGPGSTKDVSLTVTSPDGRARIYTITLRAITLGGDNTLRSLTLSPGTMSPAFSAGTQSYTVDVATAVAEVTVSATKSDPNAVISGDVPNEGHATFNLEGPGTTKIVSIIVTAPNGTSKTYTITVKRAAPSNDDNLSGLTVSPGSLDPDFASRILDYRVDVANDVDSVIISATKSDPNAVMSALGAVIAAAGTPTGQVFVPLRGRRTKVDITVTAQDRISTKIYTITIIRSRRESD